MKKIISTTLLLAFTFSAIGQTTEEDAIRLTLEAYLNGSSHSDMEQITSAFYPEADLFLSKKDQELWILSPQEYAELFKNRERGKFNGRVGKILAIDHQNTIATAKASIEIPSRNMTFIDLFLLKKLNGEWKIISKAATLMDQ